MVWNGENIPLCLGKYLNVEIARLIMAGYFQSLTLHNLNRFELISIRPLLLFNVLEVLE